MHEIESIENDIAAELARDLAPPPAAFPFKSKARPNIINVNEQPKAVAEQPKAASDQLMVAVTGLIKMEEELDQFFMGLVGDLKKAETDKAVPSQEGPLIPRMRSDSELIARLCIRVHKRIAEVKALL